MKHTQNMHELRRMCPVLALTLTQGPSALGSAMTSTVTGVAALIGGGAEAEKPDQGDRAFAAFIDEHGELLPGTGQDALAAERAAARAFCML